MAEFKHTRGDRRALFLSDVDLEKISRKVQHKRRRKRHVPSALGDTGKSLRRSETDTTAKESENGMGNITLRKMPDPDDERERYENKIIKDFRDTGNGFEEAVDKQRSRKNRAGIYLAEKSKKEIEDLIDQFNPANSPPNEDFDFYKQSKRSPTDPSSPSDSTDGLSMMSSCCSGSWQFADVAGNRGSKNLITQKEKTPLLGSKNKSRSFTILGKDPKTRILTLGLILFCLFFIAIVIVFLVIFILS